MHVIQVHCTYIHVDMCWQGVVFRSDLCTPTWLHAHNPLVTHACRHTACKYSHASIHIRVYMQHVHTHISITNRHMSEAKCTLVQLENVHTDSIFLHPCTLCTSTLMPCVVFHLLSHSLHLLWQAVTLTHVYDTLTRGKYYMYSVYTLHVKICPFTSRTCIYIYILCTRIMCLL